MAALAKAAAPESALSAQPTVVPAAADDEWEMF